VRQTLDDAGVPRSASGLSFTPFGVPQSGATPEPFGFTGELHHDDLVYLRARWYDPGSGTFTSVDLFDGFERMPYSLHPYQYGYSDPVRWTDPSGKHPVAIAGLTAAEIAFLLAIGAITYSSIQVCIVQQQCGEIVDAWEAHKTQVRQGAAYVYAHSSQAIQYIGSGGEGYVLTPLVENTTPTMGERAQRTVTVQEPSPTDMNPFPLLPPTTEEQPEILIFPLGDDLGRDATCLPGFDVGTASIDDYFRLGPDMGVDVNLVPWVLESSSLPSFQSGQLFERSFETSEGVVDVLAEIEVEGTTLHLKDIAIYPRGVEQLSPGTGAVLGAMNEIVQEAKSQGFELLRITGLRYSGANEGKEVDRTIDLTRR
jgi:RHS repeat-associated protein